MGLQPTALINGVRDSAWTYVAQQVRAQPAVRLRRAPDRPGEVIIKRLVALEGDWLYVPGRADVEKIPKARTVYPLE